MVAFLIHWASYAQNGIGWGGMRELGYYLMCTAEILIALLLILIAKGWTIVRKKISAQGRVKIAAFITMYIWSSVALQLNRKWAYNSAKMVFM